MSFGLTMNVTKFFFTPARLLAAVDKARHKRLRHAGGYMAKVARNSMRRRKAASRPGQPPSAHAPKGAVAALKAVWFAYDDSTDTVVVGPVLLNQRHLGGRTVPEIHEYGATFQARVRNVRVKGGKYERRIVRRGGRMGTVRFPARPYMRPALGKTAEKFPDMWRDSIR